MGACLLPVPGSSNRIRIFNGVNGIQGYRDIDIRSPLEVIYDDDDET